MGAEGIIHSGEPSGGSKRGGVTHGVILAVAVLVASFLDPEWAPVTGAFSPVAPVAGVALAGMLIAGPWMLPWIIGATLLSRLIQPSELSPLAMTMILVTNIIGYVVATKYLQAGSFCRELTHLADVTRFLIAALILATLSTVAPVGFFITQLPSRDVSWTELQGVILGVFFGRFVGATVVGATILTFFRLPDTSGRDSRVALYKFLCIASVMITTAIVFGPLGEKKAITWLLFPPIIWAAFLGGSPLMAKLLLLLSVGALWGSNHNFGPFSHEPSPFSILQQFLCVISVTGLVLAATANERREKWGAERRAEDLRFLSDAAVDLLLSSNVELSLRKCVERLAQRCNIDLVLYYTINGAGVQQLHRVAEYGLESYRNDQPLLEQIESQMRRVGSRQHPTAGLGDRVKSTNLLGDTTLLRLFICLPVVSEGASVGVFSVGSRTRPVLDPGEEQLLETFVFYLQSAERRLYREVERKALLESERVARIRAERADRYKDEFLAVLSHELRNPLNAILGWTQLIQRGRVDTGKAAHVIEQSARLQSQLIEDLLDMSRIESGKIILHKELVNVSNLVAATSDAMQLLAHEKGLVLQTAIEPGVELAQADAVRISQIVSNLLSNAIKFTPSNGQVRVGLQRESGEMVLTVTDTGEGISDDFLPHVFDRFRQADQSTTRRSGGLGLGLAIAKYVTEAHGGTISAHSSGLGKGASFIVRIPIHESHEEIPAHAGPISDGEKLLDTRKLTGRNIVLVEDDSATRALVTQALTERGALVTACREGSEALKRVTNQIPDLIISDIGMPGMDGYELMRRIREVTHSYSVPPAIALTAFARAEDRDRALQSGFNAHIAKPISLPRLEELAIELIT